MQPTEESWFFRFGIFWRKMSSQDSAGRRKRSSPRTSSSSSRSNESLCGQHGSEKSQHRENSSGRKNNSGKVLACVSSCISVDTVSKFPLTSEIHYTVNLPKLKTDVVSQWISVGLRVLNFFGFFSICLFERLDIDLSNRFGSLCCFTLWLRLIKILKERFKCVWILLSLVVLLML